MTTHQKRIELSKYRLQQSRDCIDEALHLLEGGKNPRSVMNRIYYSMFYAVLALIVFEEYSSSKHSGVISFFNRKFVKNNVFPKEFGRSLMKAFELRQIGDYREYKDLSIQEVTPFIDVAKDFVKEVEEYLVNEKF